MQISFPASQSKLPVLFVSHGAPDVLLNSPATVACWQQIAASMPRPQAILVISAHWEARQPTVSECDAPATLHDFSGFSPALYQMHYGAPGARDLAQRVEVLLAKARFSVARHAERGLDHGAWIPLYAMYPQADIPVTQLSLLADADPATHFELGRALAPLRDEGVLILCSGSITHNFSWLNWRAQQSSVPLAQARHFSDWVAECVAQRNFAALLNYRDAPYGADAHPSAEHFLPLFVALGATGDSHPVPYRLGYTYGSLAMDAYQWRDEPSD